ncbi:MAG: hypothetical protein QG552_2001, partial [Thermodesulfobacteriota bacterium]|nr:hypothetical protein [Thermodesulfobacteriota bacterium]
GYAFNYLALLPCKEDLRDATFDFKTRVSFGIWNENEVKFTGLYRCINCDYQEYLGSLKIGYTPKFFQAINLHTSSGRFRVDGLAGGPGSGAATTPLLGVMASRLVNSDVASIDIVGTTPTISGAATGSTIGGYIRYLR